MYTWGYLKENILAKLNLSEEEANQQNFLSNFPYYANEAMTQICSGVRPKETEYSLLLEHKDMVWDSLREVYDVYTDVLTYTREELSPSDKQYKDKKLFWEDFDSRYFVDEIITMPDDFISFSDDVAYHDGYECHDDELKYVGYNQFLCTSSGLYSIPYNARWFTFNKELTNRTVVTAPADICDAIPSYVVSQCYKIDDETKASIFRNEFEIFLARIDDTSFKQQRTFEVGGDW